MKEQKRDIEGRQRKSTYPASICAGVPKYGPCPRGWVSASYGDMLRVIERPVDIEPEKEYQLVNAKRNRGGIVPRIRLLGKEIRTAGQYTVRAGDFVIANRQIIHGGCGVVPPALGGACVSGEYTVLGANDGLLLEWLAFHTHTVHFQQTCFHSSIGVDVEKMVFKLNWWMKHRFCVPPIEEQRRIVEILQCWEGGIERAQSVVEQKQRRMKGLMQQLLTGKRRLPGFEGKWKVCRLGEMFVERNETNRTDLPLLAITGGHGIIPAADLDRKDASNADKSKYLRICPGDIGYNTMRMWQGVSAVSSIEGIVSPAYTICVPNEGTHVGFMGHFFKFQPVVHQFWKHSQGLVDDTLSLKYHNFARIKLRMPEHEEQEAIAEVLDAADAEIAAEERRLAALQQQKKGLMQKLLTGEVRIKL